MGAADTAVRSPRDYLRIYLSDHHAACRATVALGRRVLKSNEGSALGTYLADRLVPDLERDLSDLENVMRRLGFGPQRWKDAAATAAERVGRLKPNGQIRGYSPLSRVLELEGL
ncbi:MAG TPA: hypothetical protein VM573_07770, partial [Actinomycetota bacterium]|nr:hypothetical protein [Actinomycetota bacterium]